LTKATTDAGYPSYLERVKWWARSCWIPSLRALRADIRKTRQCLRMPACGFTNASTARQCSGQNPAIAVCTAHMARTGALQGSSQAHAAL